MRQKSGLASRAIRLLALRASDPITLRMPVEASWVGDGGIVRQLAAKTLLVSRNGSVLPWRHCPSPTPSKSVLFMPE